MSADDILSLAHRVGQMHQYEGWYWCATNTNFHADMMRECGRIGPNLIECVGRNLVECLATVGLTREDVVEAWRQGKLQAIEAERAAKVAEAEMRIKGKDAAKAAQLAAAEKAKPVVASTVSEPPKEPKSEPSLKPVPCRVDPPKLKEAPKPKGKPAKAPAIRQEQPSLF